MPYTNAESLNIAVALIALMMLTNAVCIRPDRASHDTSGKGKSRCVQTNCAIRNIDDDPKGRRIHPRSAIGNVEDVSEDSLIHPSLASRVADGIHSCGLIHPRDSNDNVDETIRCCLIHPLRVLKKVADVDDGCLGDRIGVGPVMQKTTTNQPQPCALSQKCHK